MDEFRTEEVLVKTYEEAVAQALNVLYPGALFLTAGDERAAERLLVRTFGEAYSDWNPERFPAQRDPDRWMQARLARRYLDDTTPARGVPGDWASVTPVPGIQPDDLLRGAAGVPGWVRPALWLVLLRQWSYGDAIAALGTTERDLRGMLAFRHELVRGAMSGAGGDRSHGAQA